MRAWLAFACLGGRAAHVDVRGRLEVPEQLALGAPLDAVLVIDNDDAAPAMTRAVDADARFVAGAASVREADPRLAARAHLRDGR